MLEIPRPEIFQAIVDRIETGVYVLDLNQKVMYWNYGAQKITGFLSQEMLGRACGEHILVEHDEHNPVVCAHHCSLESGARGHARRGVVTLLRHKSGHVLPVRLWTMALKDAAGEIVGAVKVFSERATSPELGREAAAPRRPEDLDPETGIPVRTATESFLREQIKLTEKQRVPCGVIAIRLVTLDDFQLARKRSSARDSARSVADAQGHDAAYGCSGTMGGGLLCGGAVRLRDRSAGKSGGADEAGCGPCGDFLVGGTGCR